MQGPAGRGAGEEAPEGLSALLQAWEKISRKSRLKRRDALELADTITLGAWKRLQR